MTIKESNPAKGADSGKLTNKRIEFGSGVPEVLYKRAGSRCSVPRCTRPTAGPFTENEGAVNMGMACHIFSAAENGPRGRGGKDAAFISSAENGIWCCTYHGYLIDKGKGSDYPAATLFAWKKLAEARVLKQMNDVPSPLGWVESIEFTKFANREGLPSVNLSRYTLLTGANGTGKSALMEIAAAVSNGRYAERFTGSRVIMPDGSRLPARFGAKVVYSTVDSFSKEIFLEICDDKLTRREGHIPCLLPPGDIEIIFASSSDCRKRDDEDDVDFMMRVLGVDKSTLFALAKLGTKTVMPGEIEFRHGTDEDDDGNVFARYKENGKPYIELIFKREGQEFSACFCGLSGSEQERLVVDMLITKAREVCKQRLTLLLVDDTIYSFDETNFANLLAKLAQEDFQSVVIIPPARVENTLHKVDGELRLKDQDYLEPWRLAVIDALDSVERRALKMRTS